MPEILIFLEKVLHSESLVPTISQFYTALSVTFNKFLDTPDLVPTGQELEALRMNWLRLQVCLVIPQLPQSLSVGQSAGMIERISMTLNKTM